MKCQRCKNDSEINYLENHICKSCFVKMLEKRIRKYLRVNEVVHKGDKLILVGSMSEFWINRIFTGLPLKTYKYADKGHYFEDNQLLAMAKKLKARIVIPWTMDHENKYFLQNFVEGHKQAHLGESQLFIKILKPITDQEARILSDIRHLKYKPIFEDRYSKLFNTLEQKYDSVRYAFASSVDEMVKVLKKH